MNRFISPAKLLPISELIRNKRAQIDWIYNLGILDVRCAAHFEQVKINIKKVVLLQPVRFGDPEVIEMRSKSSQEDAPDSPVTYEVVFPFSGSRRLFEYAPETFVYCKTDKGVLQPKGNNLTVKLEAPFLYHQEALQKAGGLLSLTFQFIAKNNEVVEPWSKRTEWRLDYELEKKREELLKLYGT